MFHDFKNIFANMKKCPQNAILYNFEKTPRQINGIYSCYRTMQEDFSRIVYDSQKFLRQPPLPFVPETHVISLIDPFILGDVTWLLLMSTDTFIMLGIWGFTYC